MLVQSLEEYKEDTGGRYTFQDKYKCNLLQEGKFKNPDVCENYMNASKVQNSKVHLQQLYNEYKKFSLNSQKKKSKRFVS